MKPNRHDKCVVVVVVVVCMCVCFVLEALLTQTYSIIQL